MPLLIAAALATAAAPATTGECGWVRGRYAVANGSSVRRISVTRTKRIIALRDDDQDVPPSMDRFGSVVAEYPDAVLSGDFYVCPLERSRPGRMQHVKLLRTKNLLLSGKPFQ
jgi:hypothetical protein